MFSFCNQNNEALFCILNATIKNIAAFVPSGTTNNLNAMICIKKAGFDVVLWNFQEFSIAPGSSEIPLHLHLFHELNHYRHYSTGKGAYNGIDKLQLKTKSSNLNIKIHDKDCYMHDAEEELQQIGYTVTDKDNIIIEPVNGTVYRIQKHLPIRFPYDISNLKTFFEHTPFVPISIDNSLKILSHALNKKEYNDKCEETNNLIKENIKKLIAIVAQQ